VFARDTHLVSELTRRSPRHRGYYQARTDKDKKIKNHIRQIEALLGHPITITNAA
jgi:hypothetical protein